MNSAIGPGVKPVSERSLQEESSLAIELSSLCPCMSMNNLVLSCRRIRYFVSPATTLNDKWEFSQGIVDLASLTELMGALCEPAFQNLVETSGEDAYRKEAESRSIPFR